jgi:hypothetical protein
MKPSLRLGPLVLSLLSVVLTCSKAMAVPSYARQTGLACNVCHNNPPELTAFGRKFKLNAYTLTDLKTEAPIEGKDLSISADTEHLSCRRVRSTHWRASTGHILS